MGFFLPSHMDQWVVFGVLGLWHLINTLSLFIRDPAKFRFRTWFPVNLPWAFRYMELWMTLIIILLFIFTQVSHALADISSGVIQTAHLKRFQHLTFGLFFLVYAIVGLVSEQSSLLPLPAGALHSTLCLGFLMELLVFHFGHHPGDTLESFVHLMMQMILVGLVCAMMLEILWPQSFLISISRCMLLTLKGTWFFNIGILINIPSSSPIGCTSGADDFPICAVGEPLMRAKSIEVIVFGCHVLCIVIGTYVAFACMNQPFIKRRSYFPNLEDEKGDEPTSYSELDPVGEDDDAVPIINIVPRSFSRRVSRTGTTPKGAHI